MLDPAAQVPGRLPLATPGAVSSQGPAVQRPADAGVPGASGARFQVLLEELEQRARAVARSAEEPLSAETLPAALADARGSLEDALRLHASLIEACRQFEAQGREGPP